jgi:methylphosphotriester-DNA--protein-cysteine methyltransferase
MAYTLLGADRRPYRSETPGALGGNRSTKVYGRLDCATAKRHIEKGGYVQNRVFFADEDTARAAGYRPCANCMPDEYSAWKTAGANPTEETA